MRKISATIITLNEACDIKDCLESLRWVDEIIIVDSGSTDCALDICRQYNAKIFINPWRGYVNQKNYALEKASHEWIISLDADERLSEQLTKQIKETLMQKEIEADGYFMPRRTFYLNKWINHGGWYPNYQLRLFRRDKGSWQGDDPHDYVKINGATGYLSGDILHYSYKDINDHLTKIALYTSIMAKGEFEKGATFRFSNLMIKPIAKCMNMYIIKLGFLDGFQGIAIAFLGAYYVFLKHLTLWEIESCKKQ